jgi:hypothetical protein
VVIVRESDGSTLMAIVYVLEHEHRLSEFCDDVKLDRRLLHPKKAREAKAGLREKPGFAKHPRVFHIVPMTVDADNWTEGFVTVRAGEEM